LVVAGQAEPTVDEQGRGTAGAAGQGAVGVDLDPLPHHSAVQVDGKWYAGHNHSDALERAARATGRPYDELANVATEGYRTNEGRFVTRKEGHALERKRAPRIIDWNRARNAGREEPLDLPNILRRKDED